MKAVGEEMDFQLRLLDEVPEADRFHETSLQFGPVEMLVWRLVMGWSDWFGPGLRRFL